MINDKIDKMIMASMKSHDTARTETLRAMKTAFLNWKTAKENVGKTMSEADEINILKKMVKQREESIEQYNAAGRTELADSEKMQANIIQEFLPKEATADDIVKAFEQVQAEGKLEPLKANMGAYIKSIKATLPNADGKMVADIVKQRVNYPHLKEGASRDKQLN